MNKIVKKSDLKIVNGKITYEGAVVIPFNGMNVITEWNDFVQSIKELEHRKELEALQVSFNEKKEEILGKEEKVFCSVKVDTPLLDEEKKKSEAMAEEVKKNTIADMLARTIDRHEALARFLDSELVEIEDSAEYATITTPLTLDDVTILSCDVDCFVEAIMRANGIKVDDGYEVILATD